MKTLSTKKVNRRKILFFFLLGIIFYWSLLPAFFYRSQEALYFFKETDQSANIMSTNGANKSVIFLHHSCGSNLISQGNVRSYFTGNNTDFWDHGYNAQGLTDPDGSSTGITYNVPGDNTYADGLDTLFQQDPNQSSTSFSKFLHHNDGIRTGIEYDVFVFKSCYPQNQNDSPADAYEDFIHYRNVRDRCDEISSRIFIFVTAPPLNNDQNPSYKQNNNYTRNYCWDYMTNGSFTAGHPNIFVWDWNDLLYDHNLGSNDGYGLKEEYQLSDSDSHPNSVANEETGHIFVEFVLNATEAYNTTTGGTVPNNFDLSLLMLMDGNDSSGIPAYPLFILVSLISGFLIALLINLRKDLDILS
jgi:hypothetical protein